MYYKYINEFIVPTLYKYYSGRKKYSSIVFVNVYVPDIHGVIAGYPLQNIHILYNNISGKL